MIQSESSRIVGYFGTYADAYNRVGSKFLKSRKFSIQRSSAYADHPWFLMYYGHFV